MHAAIAGKTNRAVTFEASMQAMRSQLQHPIVWFALLLPVLLLAARI